MKRIRATENPTADPRIEFALLLLAVRPSLNPSQLKRLETLWQSRPDWKRFWGLVQSHKVIPQVYDNFRQIPAGIVPVELMEKLRTGYYSNIIATSRLISELIRIVEIFKARDVAVLVLKGPSTAVFAYRSLSDRQFVDLDLVIHPQQLITVSQILTEAGYEPQFQLSPALLERYTRVNYELAFRHTDQPLVIDIHWSILPKHFTFSPDPALIWANSVPLDLVEYAYTVQSLCPEDLLLYLCAHAAKDNWVSIGAICDIAGLILQQANLNWAYLEQRAGSLGSHLMFELGIALAHYLLEVPLPANLLPIVSAQLDLAGKVISQFFTPSKGPVQWFITHNYYLKTMDKTIDRVQYWVDEVLTPTPYEWTRFKLPDYLTFLYYPLRLWHFGLKYIFKKQYKL